MKLPDDADEIETELYNYLVKNIYEPNTSAYVYSQIKDPIDKFIACFVFDLGKTRKECQVAAGLSKATVWKRIKRIKAQIIPYAKDNHLLAE
jgi:hypothetical protein